MFGELRHRHGGGEPMSCREQQTADEDVGGAGQRLFRADRPVRLDLDRQLVVVRDLADPGRLDPVVHLADRGEDRIDRDHSDRQGLRPLRGQVADAALDGDVELDRHVICVEGHQDLLGIDDLHIGRLGDVRSRDPARAALHELELDRVGREALEAELLDVQDDLGDVLLDPRDRGELLIDVPDLDGRHRRTLERGQEDTPEGVAHVTHSRPAAGRPVLM